MKYSRKEFLTKIHQHKWGEVFQEGDFLLNQIVESKFSKKWKPLKDTKQLYEFLKSNAVFETVMLNYVAKKPDDLTLVIYRDPLTKKNIGYDIGETETIEANIKWDAVRDPMQLWWYVKTNITLSKGKVLTIAISEKFWYLQEERAKEHITKNFLILLKTHTKQALTKYDDDDFDYIGEALAELMPLLQVIDEAESWEE